MITTTVFAALATIMYVFLTARVIVLRGRHRVSVGDGEVSELMVAIRAHANFNEYIPLAIIMMLLLELSGVATVYLYLFGTVILLGRVLHAFAFRSPRTTVSIVRIVAMMCTFSPLLLTALFFLVRFMVNSI